MKLATRIHPLCPPYVTEFILWIFSVLGTWLKGLFVLMIMSIDGQIWLYYISKSLGRCTILDIIQTMKNILLLAIIKQFYKMNMNHI